MNYSTNFTDTYNENSENSEDVYPFGNFAPTLAQCYLIVSFGYVLAKFGPLSKTDVRGVCAFASYFAMPAIICVSIADANFNDFHWQLLVGIIAGKFIIYVIIAAIMIYLKKPSSTTLAGIYAMFCVQCNDLPVGNPLMTSLYRFVRPHMMKYLFFLPSLTLIVFGPISHLMIDGLSDESQKNNKETRETTLLSTVASILRKLLKFISKELFLSPVIIATVSGLMLNLIFKAKMPAILRHPVHVLAETIPGIALSILGFNMIGNERYLLSSYIVTALVLVFVKMVLTPLVLHAVVKSISFGIELRDELCDFALLYGIISPASVIFAEATRRNVLTAIMGVTLLISSLSCFPLSYVIARLTIARPTSLSTYRVSIDEVSFVLSCLSLTCGVASLISIWWNKLSKTLPHVLVECLIAFQVLIACAIILPALTDSKHVKWIEYIYLALSVFAEIGASTWTAVMAVFVIMQKKQRLILQSTPCVLFAVNCCFSALISVITVVLEITDDGKFNTFKNSFAYGTEFIQLCLTTSILTLSVAVSLICIVVQHRHAVSSKACTSAETKSSSESVYFTNGGLEKTQCSYNNFQYDISKSSSMLVLQNAETKYYNEVAFQENKALPFGPTWTNRIMSLLTLMTMVTSVKIFRNFYVLFDCEENSIILLLEYLQAFSYLGQGIISLLTFGIDVRTLNFMLTRWFIDLKYKKEKVEHVGTEEQEAINKWCSQFLVSHYPQCYTDLARERTWKGFQYSDSFWGHQMVQWLVSAGMAKDVTEAEVLGQWLFLGGVIHHVNEKRNFHDAPYLFCFSKRSTYL